MLVGVLAAAPRPSLPADLDALASSFYASDRPGAAVIVVKNGDTVLRKGYGLASLELDVPVSPDTVFEIGSVTKQFTAAAALMLAQDGALALSDDFRKYVRGFPLRDRTITVQQLLCQTSGIADYTESPQWRAASRDEVPVDELIDVIGHEPQQFRPGVDWRYSNSNYALLGAVIERASGMRYGDFLAARIFQPLGMIRTAYPDDRRVIAHRAPGYAQRDGRWIDAPPLSVTQLFAAGGLVSTVDDLARWNAALDGTALLSDASKRRMWTPCVLDDGRQTGYADGWMTGRRDGRRVVEHDGAIDGFQSEVVRLPDDGVFAAVLSNDGSTGTSARLVAERLAAAAAGWPLEDPTAAPLPPAADLAGSYTGLGQTFTVAVREGRLSLAERGDWVRLVPSGPDEFFAPGDFLRLRFQRTAGAPVGVIVHTFAREVEATRVAHPAAALSAGRLDRCVGDYRVAPGFTIEIRREGARLVARWTGQQDVELVTGADGQFALESIGATMTFTSDRTGRVTGLVLHQQGTDRAGVKVK